MIHTQYAYMACLNTHMSCWATMAEYIQGYAGAHSRGQLPGGTLARAQGVGGRPVQPQAMVHVALRRVNLLHAPGARK